MENALQKNLKRHWPVLLLTFMVGLLYAGPDFYRMQQNDYRGVMMTAATDEDYYATVINKSYSSSGFVRDPFQYEYKDRGNPFQFFPIEFALGKLGSFFKLSLDKLIVLMDFVFPALLFLCSYAFALYLTKSRVTAFATSAALLLGNEIVHPDSFHNLINTFTFHGSYKEFLTYSRPINPQESSFFFFVALFTDLYLFNNPSSKRALLLAGLALGALAYIYPYYWLFAFVLLGTLFLYALIRRNRELILGTLGTGVMALVVMLPFLIINMPVFLHGGSALTQAIPSHRIIIERLVLLPIAIYLLIGWYGHLRKDKDTVGAWAQGFFQKYTYVLLLLIVSVIVSNHQVLDGHLIFQQHFHFFTNIPMFLIAMTILGMEIVHALIPKWRLVLTAAFCLGIMWYTLGVQISSYKANIAESHRQQALAPVLTYLNTATTTPVVFADGYWASRITVLSSAYAYTAYGSDATFEVSHERLVHDYLVLLRVQGVTPANVRSYLESHRDEVSAAIFIATYWRDWCGSYGCFPDSVIDELTKTYTESYKIPLTTFIHRYRAEYALVDTNKDVWQLDGVVEDTPVLSSGDFALYRFK